MWEVVAAKQIDEYENEPTDKKNGFVCISNAGTVRI